jgi:4a-hydroxytetrahydrobiopterin dehydratase
MIARVTLRLYSIPILVEFPTRHVDRARFKPPVRLMASASDLGSQKCVPCEGSNDIKVLDQPTAEAWLAKVSPTWNVVDQGGSLHLVSKLTTKNFLSALEICNRVGVVAEQEGHHPDLHIEAWNKLTIE